MIKNIFKSRLTFRNILLFILLGLLTTASSAIIGYIDFSEHVKNDYYEQADNIAKFITYDIDIEDLNNRLNAFEESSGQDPNLIIDVENSENYKNISDNLDELVRSMDLTGIFIGRFDPDETQDDALITFYSAVFEKGDELIQIPFGVVDVYPYKNKDINLLIKDKVPVHLESQIRDSLTMTSLEPILDSEGNIVATICIIQSIDLLYSAQISFAVKAVGASLIIMILLILIFIAINKTIFLDPLQKIITSTNNFVKKGKVAEEELESIRTDDEMEDLAQSIVKMEKDIVDYISNINKIESEREREKTELDIATKIQKSMLPQKFPAFPDRDEFDIYATMEPAKEVGGDFYDFFMIDEDHLGIVIADVSGKGVPAALFMVIAKTLIKDHANLGLSPEEVFNEVNNILDENNSENMFVTAWFGIYEISSGKLTYVNAGHNAPVLLRNKGNFEFIKSKGTLFLAGLKDYPYTSSSIDLTKGDKLFLYTDGVTEDQNENEDFFGENRLLETLNKNKDKNIYDLLKSVRAEIETFQNEASQFDDITMVGFEVKD